MSRGFCLIDSETEQRALQFLHIYCSDERSHSSAPESNKQDPRDRTLDLSIFFRYKQIPKFIQGSKTLEQIRIQSQNYR